MRQFIRLNEAKIALNGRTVNVEEANGVQEAFDAFQEEAIHAFERLFISE